MAYRPKRSTPYEERLARNTQKTETCWFWTGPHYSNGYGTIGYHGKRESTHRLAWILKHGPIPEGMCVCHRCDVRNCVNPDHLFLGTVADNGRDKTEKGRNPGNAIRGPKRRGNVKLTDDDVMEIRRLYKPRSRELGSVALAKRFGVAKRTILNVLNRKTWTHI